jgi:hypothetical protein
MSHAHCKEPFSSFIFDQRKIRNEIWLYLNNHLEKLLESSFSPKSLFLAFRKDIENLLELLLLLPSVVRKRYNSNTLLPPCLKINQFIELSKLKLYIFNKIYKNKHKSIPNNKEVKFQTIFFVYPFFRPPPPN